MSAWSHLPNAKRIDWVLASCKENPEAWNAARNAAWYAALGAARNAARDAARNAAQIAARNAAYDGARNTAYDAVWDAAYDAARGATIALIAYDHCKKYLRMTPDELITWWKLSDDPACILLIPMVKVLQTQKELA